MTYTASNKLLPNYYKFMKTTVSSSALQKLPEDLQYMTYLREWHIHRTQIQKLPDFIEQFVDLCVLNIPKNKLTQLPAEIGQFITVSHPLFIFFFFIIYIRLLIIALPGINESIIVIQYVIDYL